MIRIPTHLRLGPVVLKLHNRNLAPYGWPRLKLGGLSLFARDITGGMQVAAYHPKGCLTWHWYATVAFRRTFWAWSARKTPRLLRRGQWLDSYSFPFWLTVYVGRQDYHKPKPSAQFPQIRSITLL